MAPSTRSSRASASPRVQQRWQAKHTKPTPLLPQTPMSPSPGQQPACTPCLFGSPKCQPPPSRAEIFPAPLPLPPNAAAAAAPGEGQENWVQPCSPRRVRGKGSPCQPALSPSRSLAPRIPVPPERRQRCAGFKGTVQSRACSRPDARSSFPGHHERCRKALPFFETREGTSSPNSSSLSFPLSRTTSSPFSTKASKIGYK